MTITLKTLPEATPQQVFDHVSHHLLQQDAQSVCRYNGVSCQYRGSASRLCAGGCLISDAEYDEAMEGNSWPEMARKEWVPPAHEALIHALQRVHDQFEPAEWPRQLAHVAHEYALRSTVMNKGRLELMVTMLHEVAAGTWRPAVDTGKPMAFALDAWLIAVVGGQPTRLCELDDEAQPCGYVACAIGHATLDARFNALGFEQTAWGPPQFDSLPGWPAVTSFFELTYEQATEMFTDGAYTAGAAGPLDVAARITRYLED